MFERLLILLLVAGAIAALLGALRYWRARSLARLAAETPFAAIIPPGRPAVIAFSAPNCAECRTRQGPALERLAAEWGEAVVIRSLAAPAYPELVDRLGLLTVPATAVVDSRGRVRALNLGYAPAEQLAAQLRAL